MSDIKKLIEKHRENTLVNYFNMLRDEEDTFSTDHCPCCYRRGYDSLAPLLERAMKQLKDECYCTHDYEPTHILCDPCETLAKIKAELEGVNE
jgi:hypothetical protein